MAHASQGRPPPRPDAPPSGADQASPPDLLTALRRIAACAAHPAERTVLFQTIAGQAAALATADVVLATCEDDLLHVVKGTGSLAWLEGEFLPGRGSFVGSALQARAPRDAVRLNSHDEAYPLEEELGSGPALAVPLMLEDRALGAILLLRPSGERPFTQEEAAELSALAGVSAAVVAGAEAYDRRRASRDAALRARRSDAPKVAVLKPAGLTAAELIRAVRHEINNPLAVVRARTQLLERDGVVQAEPALLETVQQVAEAARRLAELTARLAAAEAHPDHAYVTADGGIGVVPEPSS